MRPLYRLLMKLYPPEYRLQFEDEMSAVFAGVAAERRAEGRRAYARFLARELAGLLAGACRERAAAIRFIPILGAIGLALVLHALLYSAALRMVHGFSTAACRSLTFFNDPKAAGLTAAVLGVICLLCLMPLFFLLSIRLTYRRRQG